MNGILNYLESFFSLNNPVLYGFIISAVVVTALVIFYFRYFLPIQRKRFEEKQKHILEKAELMWMFSEMDPSPQIRINPDGTIAQTNLAARSVFNTGAGEGKNISNLIPSFSVSDAEGEKHFLEYIGKNIYSVNVRPGKNHDFINIYLYDITKQKNYEISLEEYKNKLKELAIKLDDSVQSTKKDIALELHDDIGHRLMALKLKASGDSVPAREILPDLERMHERVRELSHELRPADVQNLGLQITLRGMIETISANSSIKGVLEFFMDEDPEIEISNCIVRVVQEAMSNILKHSGASEFSVSLQAGGGLINLLIYDNGKGIPQSYLAEGNFRHFGIGLFNMKERVENFKGSFKITSEGGEGTLLIINIPYGGN